MKCLCGEKLLKCNICGSDLTVSADSVMEYYDDVPKLIVRCNRCFKKVEINGYTELTAHEISKLYAKSKNMNRRYK
jgi:hypothetical protein